MLGRSVIVVVAIACFLTALATFAPSSASVVQTDDQTSTDLPPEVPPDELPQETPHWAAPPTYAACTNARPQSTHRRAVIGIGPQHGHQRNIHKPPEG